MVLRLVILYRVQSLAREECSCLVGCEMHSNFGSPLLLFILRLVGRGYFFRGHLVHVACKQIISNFVYDLDSVK